MIGFNRAWCNRAARRSDGRRKVVIFVRSLLRHGHYPIARLGVWPWYRASISDRKAAWLTVGLLFVFILINFADKTVIGIAASRSCRN
jgi:hypothetical protein